MTDTGSVEYSYIRRVLGAVGENANLVTDEEIAEAFLAASHPDWRLAAAYLADSLAARAINDPTSFAATGDMSVSWSNRAQMWMNIAKQLRKDFAEAQEDAHDPGGLISIGLRREKMAGEPSEYTRARRYRNWKVE